MPFSSYHDSWRTTRRSLLLGAAAGLAAGTPLGWLAYHAYHDPQGDGDGQSRFTGRTREVGKPEYAMPGPFPGRVVEVYHPESVRADNTIDADAVKAMMERGMRELTGMDDAVEAWRRLFQKGDVVGIKVNPVGRKPRRGEPGRRPSAVGSISSPEVLIETVAMLQEAGVAKKGILVFERYANEFRQAGYEDVMGTRPLDGVRWYASASGYDDTQLEISGFPRSRTGPAPEDRGHVVGYDPDAFVHMGFAAREHDRKDERRFRSHLSVIVTRMVNKFITIPVLKDHRSAGVTLALKNMSHGMNNNVARSHLSGFVHGGFAKGGGEGLASGPNQCNVFIPTAVNQEAIRRKAVLHILDGLIGVYEGGPGSWNTTWATWPHRSLFFATDPVAMDHVGWDIIDAKRAREGWRPVGQMGLSLRTAGTQAAMQLAPLGSAHSRDAVALAMAAQERLGGERSEAFDRRQPEHVILAESLALGVFDPRGIEHRRIALG